MDLNEKIAIMVTEGTTGCQFAIPDAKYIGDMFIITNSRNDILMIFAWDGERWRNNYEEFEVQYKLKYSTKPLPTGNKK